MATREQLIEDFADHKLATGEKFERLINSMKTRAMLQHVQQTVLRFIAVQSTKTAQRNQVLLFLSLVIQNSLSIQLQHVQVKAVLQSTVMFVRQLSALKKFPLSVMHGMTKLLLL